MEFYFYNLDWQQSLLIQGDPKLLICHLINLAKVFIDFIVFVILFVSLTQPIPGWTCLMSENHVEIYRAESTNWYEII